jgi:hypothetical protein
MTHIFISLLSVLFSFLSQKNKYPPPPPPKKSVLKATAEISLQVNVSYFALLVQCCADLAYCCWMRPLQALTPAQMPYFKEWYRDIIIIYNYF